MDGYTTYYDDLGVPEDASTQQIRLAYHKKIMEYHPDHLQRSPDWVKRQAEETTKLLNEAYSILINPAKRKIYDEEIKAFREDSRRAAEVESQRREEEERLRREAAERLRREEAERRHRADEERIRREEADVHRRKAEAAERRRREKERRRKLIFWTFALGGVVVIIVVLARTMPEFYRSSNSTQLTAFEMAIGKYQLAEKAALQTLDPDVVAQLPVFAHGEALDDIRKRVEMLKAQGLYQELTVQQQGVQPEVLRDGEIVGVLVQKQYTVRTYQPTADGDRLVDEQVFEGKIVYGLTYLDSRWKVDRVRPIESTGQAQQ